MIDDVTTVDQSHLPKYSEPTYSEDMPQCKCKAQPNFEFEYYRLIEEVKSLETENARLRDTVLGMCKWLFAERE